MIDGVALTSLRTPATSAVAAAELADPDPANLLVFGSGPQAVGHVVALTTLFPRLSVSIVARRAEGVAAAIGKLDALGIEATAGSADEVPEADLIVTATSSSEPVFDGSGVRDGACVLAIGSHSPARRELDSTLMGRSLVVVEDLGTARRECGDVVIAAGEDGSRWAPCRTCPTWSADGSAGPPTGRMCSRVRGWPGRTWPWRPGSPSGTPGTTDPYSALGQDRLSISPRLGSQSSST